MSKHKSILVIDVEATCWDDGRVDNHPSRRNEIIEIGIAEIGLKSKKIERTESIIVKPNTSTISPFCTKLTTLTPEFVEEKGVSYWAALDILDNKYKAYQQIFASWGDYDRKAFERNCAWCETSYPFGNMHLNVKALFLAKYGYTGGQQKCGNDLGIKMEGTAHRGIDDAVNIAKILLKLL